MGTLNPNQTLLQSKNQSASDLTPAALSGPKSLVTFEDLKVAPPASLYITRDDILTVAIQSEHNGGNCTCNVRMLRPDTGEIIPFQFLLPTPTPFVPSFFSTVLDEGFLLSIVIQANSETQVGATFVTAILNRNQQGALLGLPGQVLVRDYVTNLAPATWPGSRMTLPTEGPGNPKEIVVSNPAAGADWTQVVPSGANWELVALNAVLTTAVAVANRNVQLVLDDSATPLFTGSAVASIPASTVANVSGAQLAPTVGADALDISLPIPPRNWLIGSAGWHVRVATQNIQAADQWSNIRLLVREWMAI